VKSKKAFVGFYDSAGLEYSLPNTAVATGNWGCGIFGANKAFKSLIQILAASETEKKVIYYTFGDQQFSHRLKKVIEDLKQRNMTVGELWKSLMNYKDWVKETKGKKGDVFNSICDSVELPTNPRGDVCVVM